MHGQGVYGTSVCCRVSTWQCRASQKPTNLGWYSIEQLLLSVCYESNSSPERFVLKCCWDVVTGSIEHSPSKTNNLYIHLSTHLAFNSCQISRPSHDCSRARRTTHMPTSKPPDDLNPPIAQSAMPSSGVDKKAVKLKECNTPKTKQKQSWFLTNIISFISLKSWRCLWRERERPSAEPNRLELDSRSHHEIPQDTPPTNLAHDRLTEERHRICRTVATAVALLSPVDRKLCCHARLEP